MGTEIVRETARRQLQESGIEFTEGSFLHHVAFGQHKIVDLFLVAGMDPNVKNGHGHSAIVVAAKSGHDLLVTLLCDHGAKVQDLVKYCESTEATRDWDKKAVTLAPYLSAIAAVLVAFVGAWFTYSYNSQQSEANRINEEENRKLHKTELLLKAIPELTGDSKHQTVSLIAIQILEPGLAIKIGSTMRGQGVTEAFTQMSTSTIVPREQRSEFEQVAGSVSDSAKQQAAYEATTWLKKTPPLKYDYGGKTPEEGFDPAGFVAYIFSRVGLIPDSMYKYYNSAGLQLKYHLQPVLTDSLQPGDLIFYADGNCMIYQGGPPGQEQMIGMLSTGLKQFMVQDVLEDRGPHQRIGYGRVSIVSPTVLIQFRSTQQLGRVQDVARALTAVGFDVPEPENIGSRGTKNTYLRNFRDGPTSDADRRKILEVLTKQGIRVQEQSFSQDSSAAWQQLRQYELWCGADF